MDRVARVGGARNMKSMRPPLRAIFYALFLRGDTCPLGALPWIRYWKGSRMIGLITYERCKALNWQQQFFAKNPDFTFDWRGGGQFQIWVKTQHPLQKRKFSQKSLIDFVISGPPPKCRILVCTEVCLSPCLSVVCIYGKHVQNNRLASRAFGLKNPRSVTGVCVCLCVCVCMCVCGRASLFLEPRTVWCMGVCIRAVPTGIPCFWNRGLFSRDRKAIIPAVAPY